MIEKAIPTLVAAREADTLLQRYFPPSRLVRVSIGQVYVKLESDLPTGSFKPRGALHALARNLARRTVREVTASSTGNHGAAVAFAAQQLGVAATIFLPSNANPVKRARIASLGARIVEDDTPDIAAACQRAMAYAASKSDVYFLNDATDPDLPAGPGTIALELLEQLPAVDTIVVPMGDTALVRGVAGIAKQLSPNVRVVGVQAARAPSYVLSWKDGRVITTDTCDTIADGLATRTPEAENVQAIRELVDEVVLVSEDEMLGAIWHLASVEHVIAEPAGAAATAALLHAKFAPGDHTVLLVTGANITPDVLRSACACR
jgi:threonine dehydratase